MAMISRDAERVLRVLNEGPASGEMVARRLYMTEGEVSACLQELVDVGFIERQTR